VKFGVIVFPASNCDHDCFHVATEQLGHEAEFIWHRDEDLKGCDCVILPGGFSYGDYLRSGAMAACSPIMNAVREYAAKGGLVIGICNGFQILQEAGLLPGALMRNKSLKFICKDVCVRVEHKDGPFTNKYAAGDVLKIPVAHMDGNFSLDKKTLTRLEKNNQILFRYCTNDGHVDEESNPNGSSGSVAGITNENGNVCGMMPHPERCSEELLGSVEGIKIFESIVNWYEANK
jgi:phosphoribosylformylglycinamidine synthase subunit PurQ / glutaminase